MPDLSLSTLRAAGEAAGLDAVGIAPATPFESTRGDLERRKAAGLHGGMQFTYRKPERSTDPGQALPGARCLVVGARRYPGPAATAPEPEGRPTARVAAYAGDDHYGALRSGLEAVARVLTDAGCAARVLVDDNALVDREAAYRAGLGWYGKSSNLLLPGQGSWFVLGSVLTDADLPTNAEPVPDGCGACTRCIDGCPTGAIVAPGVVDARRCLAWLVQAIGTFPAEHRVALGDRIYGCDTCQEVCPPNRRAPRSADDAPVPVLDLLASSDEELLARHGRWYIPRRDPAFVRRNALVVLGNVSDGSDPAVAEVLARYLRHHRPMLRAHAVWAARRLGREDLLAHLADDDDPEVRAELERAVVAPRVATR
ncbi:MAG: tRNA epoxyqueuosine(34) reductase QueG [Acidimicrobiia bacterium]|nr:tRNA epoxyqueuosine(34) reductase QueG [Acidimicrobiia bacterium]